MRLRVSIWVFVCVLIVVSFFGGNFFSSACQNFRDNDHLFAPDATSTAPGYILVAQYSIADRNSDSGRIELLDESGNVVHTWATKYTPLEARLEENGNLMVSMTPPSDLNSFPALGTTGLMQELDWNGKVLWEYQDTLMNHDFELMDDGTVVYSRWSVATSSFASGTRGGFRSASSTTIWVNDLVRVNKSNKIVWKWHMQDHLSPADYYVGPYIPISDWSHMNSVRYISDNPLTHTPAYLLSLRNVNAVLMIDEETGNVIWRTPANIMTTQHDATLLSNGNVLIFNNGFLMGGSITTSVFEINPRTNEVAWQYKGGQGGGVLFSTILAGGAQRLPNGNTLITLSTQGRILEITKDKRTVWEYWSLHPYNNTQHWVFKAHKYDAAGTVWESFVQPPLYAQICRY